MDRGEHMQIAFYIDQTRCIGCFTCAVACKDWNDISDGPANWKRILPIEEGKRSINPNVA